MEKHIEIGGKDYILLPTRKTIKTIYNISPEFLDLQSSGKKINKKEQTLISVELMAGVDWLFYDLISGKQPSISKEESDAILMTMESEYGLAEADNFIIELCMTVFNEGEQEGAKKKKVLPKI